MILNLTIPFKNLWTICTIIFSTKKKKKKTHPYVESQVLDASTIETETQAINDEFDKLKQQFGTVNDAATKQKKQDDAIKLIDDILDEGNPFKNINTEDIWIEDNFFDNNNKEAIKDISKDIIDTTNETITLDNDYSIEIIVINEDIDIPSDDGLPINSDLPKKVKIISSNGNKIRLAADKLKTNTKSKNL